MANSAGTIQCPNYSCQADNHQSDKFCHSCGTPLIKRYLWAMGSGIDPYKLGDAIADRYLLVRERILLDTTPAVPPDTPEEVPPELLPYLKLSPHRLHIPQVYGRLKVTEKRRNSEIWLLEDMPIRGSEAGEEEGKLFPELTSLWQNTPPVRQLNWLWQWANLWEPLLAQGVASSLMEISCLRVEGSLLRLLELKIDRKTPPTLQQLGQLWLTLIDGASPEIKRYFHEICTQLIQQQITTSDQLVTILDRGLYDCARSQKRTYKIITATDSGPSRDHNEDDCYPPSGELIVSETDDRRTLAIVCDGIGGHPGGEIASPLAINTLSQRLETLSESLENWHPETISQELEEAACAANDAISQQNDRENRSDRQRMGTTLVMAKTFAHEMYITHVGDSRVYWVTKQGCHQVTQDDDLASREVRLGYSLYRNALQHRSSGSLVQALGISSSATLHPTVQRFVIDESCIFLLCSDGLSDYDRVDQYWQREIIPILEGSIDLPTAATRLIEIANTQNGHDNATVALVYCEVTPYPESGQTELSPPQLELMPPVLANPGKTAISKTPQIAAERNNKRPWWLFFVFVVFFFLGLGGVLAAIKFGGIDLVARLIGRGDVASINTSPDHVSDPEITPSQPESIPETSPAALEKTPTSVAVLNVPKLIELKELIKSQSKDISLVKEPEKILKLGLVPRGSILQVIGSKKHQDEEWALLRVCSIGTENIEVERPIPREKLAKKGDIGWVKAADVLVEPNFQSTPEQKSECSVR